MKNYKTLVFLLLLSSGLAAQSYNDSLLIYNAYKGQINAIRLYSDSLNYNAWFKIEDNVSDDIVKAFHRLEMANHQSYAAADSLTVETFGIARSYPYPTGTPNKLPQGYSVLSIQIHFMVNSKNMTTVPYLEQWYYNKQGVVLKVIKRDPTTLQQLAELN
jgi:hypothetical protein